MIFAICHYQEAFVDLNHCIQLRNGKPEAYDYYMRGATHYQLNNYQEALVDFNHCIQLRNDQLGSSVYYWRGLTHFQLNNKQEAISDFNESLKLLRGKHTADDYHWRGRTYYELNQYQEALTNLNHCIQLRNGNPDADDYYWRGKIHYQLGNFTEAKLDFHNYYHLLNKNPPRKDYPEFKALIDTAFLKQECLKEEKEFFTQAELAEQNKLFEKAIEAISNAILLNPQNFAYYFRRATYYFVLNKLNEAISDYENVLRLSPDNAEAHYELGRIYTKLHQYTLAIENFEKAITQNPNEIKYYIGCIYSQFCAEHYQEAEEQLQQARHLFGNNPDLFGLQGLILSEKKEYQKAITYFEKTFFQNQYHLNNNINRGFCYLQLGEYAKAKRIFTHIINKTTELDTSKAIFLFFRGCAYKASGKIEKALKDTESANQILKNEHNLSYSTLWLTQEAHQQLIHYHEVYAQLKKQKNKQNQQSAEKQIEIAQNFFKHGVYMDAIEKIT
ncbi:MAG: Cell division coordinator CpoB [Legionellaceae bacterium]